MGRCDEAIAGIYVRRQVLYRQDKSLRLILGWIHHRQPVADDRVHDHVEDCGGQGFAMGYAAVSLKHTPKASAGPGHRWELLGNYPVFTVVMLIYHYVERTWRILVTPDFLYNIYDHEKTLSRWTS